MLTPSYAGGDTFGEWCGTTLNTRVTVLQSNRQPFICHAIHDDEDNHEK